MGAQSRLQRLALCSGRGRQWLPVRGVQTASESGALGRSSQTPSPSLPLRETVGAVERLPRSLEYRNLLRSCSKIFDPDTPLRSGVWRERLERASDALEGTSNKPTRIAVVGASLSGTAHLITCLLDEPLGDVAAPSSLSVDGAQLYDNEAKMQALRARYTGKRELVHSPLKIRHGQHLGESDDLKDFEIPHPWLKSARLEVVEILNPTTSSSLLNELYASDMVLFVTDDLTLIAHHRSSHNLKLDPTLQLLRYFAHKPATRVIVNHVTSHTFDEQEFASGLKAAIGTDAYTSLQRRPSRTLAPADGIKEDALLHTSFDMAARANDALRSALSRPATGNVDHSEGQAATDWTAFSALYSASGVVRIKTAMESIPVCAAFSSEERGGARLQTTNYLIRQSLDQALFGVSAEVDEVRQAQGAAIVLREEVEASKAKAAAEVFSLARHDYPSRLHERAGDRSQSAEGPARDSKGSVEETFATRLPWWRILWKVDDVRAETEAAVDRSFAKDVEKQLTFETGKLLSAAERLQQRTSSVFKLLNPNSQTSYKPLDSLERDHGTFQSAFHSPILLNELRQHSIVNVEKRLRPDLLTMPIERRRRQLLALGGPVDVLCLRAQRGVLTALGLVGSTGLLTVVGAVAGGPLGASLPSLVAPLAMQVSTAAASFAFASVFSAWLLQSRWTRAKKRFWRDWERIASGLDADLKRNLDDVFETVVGAQSIKAASGLEMLAMRRLAQLERLYESIEAATSEVKSVTAKPPSNHGDWQSLPR